MKEIPVQLDPLRSDRLADRDAVFAAVQAMAWMIVWVHWFDDDCFFVAFQNRNGLLYFVNGSGVHFLFRQAIDVIPDDRRK